MASEAFQRGFSRPQCFTGHKAAVIDITAFENDCSTIVTSSEDNTLRLWDLQTGKTRQCITGFGTYPINIIRYAPYDRFLLFGMTDDAIITFDLRREGLLVRDSHKRVYSHSAAVMAKKTGAEEGEVSELSSFAVHPKESLHLLVVGDDEGTVTVVNSQSGEVIITLSRIHSNVIGAVAFQPNSQQYLCSGGFDSIFCCWDFSRGRVSGQTIDFSREQQQQQQMANPPFVHDLLYREGGRQVVSALGDGSLRLLRYEPKQGFVYVGGAREAHGGMATCVCACSVLAKDIVNIEQQIECVMSAGIDCHIRGWNIVTNSDKTGKVSVDSGIGVQQSSASASKNNKKKNKKKQQQKLQAVSSLQPLPPPAPTDAYTFAPLFEINHIDKINAIAYVNSGDRETGTEIGAGVAVADVTSVWKLYKMQG